MQGKEKEKEKEKEKDYDWLPAAKKRTGPVKRQCSRIKEAGSRRKNQEKFKAWRRLRESKKLRLFHSLKYDAGQILKASIADNNLYFE